MSRINLEEGWQMGKARRVGVSPCIPQPGSRILRTPQVLRVYSPPPEKLVRLPRTQTWMPQKASNSCANYIFRASRKCSTRLPFCSGFTFYLHEANKRLDALTANSSALAFSGRGNVLAFRSWWLWSWNKKATKKTTESHHPDEVAWSWELSSARSTDHEAG